MEVDNESAIMRRLSFWSGFAEPALTKVCAFLAGVLRTSMPVDISHIRGHSGHHWNEYADVQINFACRQEFVCF